VNLSELGYRALYLHLGEKPLVVVFSLGFRSVVEMTKYVKKELGYKIAWISPHTPGFHYEPYHDVIGTDVVTLAKALELRQDRDHLVSMIVHMAAPHTASWKIKKRIPGMKVVAFMYDIMDLWVPHDQMQIWDEYDDAKGSNPAEYHALEEVMRGDYIEGLAYKDWGQGWPLITETGLPTAWWPSTVSEKLYQKPPDTKTPFESFAYVGTIMPKRTHDRPSGLFSDIMMETIFREVSGQGFPIHAYVMRPDADVIKEYKALFPGGSGVKMIPGDNLQNLLPRLQGRYKWGWMMYHFPAKIVMPLVENSLPTKLFTYMALAIPPVVSEEMTAVARFVKEHNIGVVVSQRDIANLRQKLAKVDHAKLVQNILKVRPRYSMEQVVGNLGGLLQTVMDGPCKPIPEKPEWLEIDEKIEKERAETQKKKTESTSGWKARNVGIETGAGAVYTEHGDPTR
jgi:hypothetical protein